MSKSHSFDLDEEGDLVARAVSDDAKFEPNSVSFENDVRDVNFSRNNPAMRLSTARFQGLARQYSHTAHVSIFGLLISCVLLIFVLPLYPDSGGWISKIIVTLIIILGTLSISSNSIRLGIVSFLVIFSEWITGVFDFEFLHHVSEVVVNCFLIWMVSKFVLRIMSIPEVSVLTLVEAMNGYFLLGVMLIRMITYIENYNPGSFSIANPSQYDLGYFTLITFTTTGYGDITPVTKLARSLSLLTAIAGQFYVAVIVAVIVGKYSSRAVSSSK